jgi:hypothetical protein
MSSRTTATIVLALALGILAPVVTPARAEVPADADKITTHLEFLGYTVSREKDDLIAKHPKEWNISLRAYQGGILIAAFLESDKKAKQDRTAFLEAINSLNQDAKGCRYYADKDGDLAVESWYAGEYDKARFGTFIDVWKADSDDLKGNSKALAFLK